MAQSPISKCLALTIETEEDKKRNQEIYRHYKDYVLSLPVVTAVDGRTLYQYKNLYAYLNWMVGAMVARQLFQAKSSDVIVATLPKSGTTWLKTLIFATENRNSSCSPSNILTSLGSHDCVPFLEQGIYCENQVPNLNLIPDPRLFSSHLPFDILPESIIQSRCKIIYLCREMKDTFISRWHFINKIREKNGKETVPLEQALDQFCDGICFPGSCWDHVLGYWKASQEHPDRVMFMTYEELIGDTASALRKLAEFIGCPFTLEEDKQNVVDEIVNFCAFENLSNLEVNKTGLTKVAGVENSILFRHGKIGDWVNYLTPEMANRLDNISLNKFEGTGLVTTHIQGMQGWLSVI